MWVRVGFGAWCLREGGSKAGLELGTRGFECTEGVWEVSRENRGSRTELLGLGGLYWGGLGAGRKARRVQEATEAGTGQ